MSIREVTKAAQAEAVRQRPMSDGGHRGDETSQGPSKADAGQAKGPQGFCIQKDKRDTRSQRSEASGGLLYVPEVGGKKMEDRQRIRHRHAAEGTCADGPRGRFLSDLW